MEEENRNHTHEMSKQIKQKSEREPNMEWNGLKYVLHLEYYQTGYGTTT